MIGTVILSSYDSNAAKESYQKQLGEGIIKKEYEGDATRWSSKMMGDGARWCNVSGQIPNPRHRRAKSGISHPHFLPVAASPHASDSMGMLESSSIGRPVESS